METTESSTILTLESPWVKLRTDFLDRYPGDTMGIDKWYTMDTNFLEFLEQLKSVISTSFSEVSDLKFKLKTTYMESDLYVIRLTDSEGTQPLMVSASTSNKNTDPTVKLKGRYSVGVVGDTKIVLAIRANLKKQMTDTIKLSQIEWWFVAGNSISHQAIVLEKPKEALPEFYPWLDRSPIEYFNDFLKSEATVLMMMGPPGTGKSSLLKHFLYNQSLNAIVTYDKQLLASDALFLNLINSKVDALIVEDADDILTDRDKTKNTLMARFLNVADGLIKFPNKKLIFTSNIESLDDIDPALVRPGRCFDVLHFRRLTEAEANKAADAAGIERPNKSVTLAELFNPNFNSDQASKQKTKVGFSFGRKEEVKKVA